MLFFTEEQKARFKKAFSSLTEEGAEMLSTAQRTALDEVKKGLDALLKQVPAKPELTAAEKMHQGCFAEMHVEEMLDKIWPDMVGRTGSDHYDNSLEIYCVEEAPATMSCSMEQADEIFKLGFSRFWLNFCDGTEQAVCLVDEKIVLGHRRKAPGIPRGGVRESALRSKLYALIDAKEAKILELEAKLAECQKKA
jgi:hypothetical protein